MTPSLMIQRKLHCRSRKQKRKNTNQWQCSTPGLTIGWFFRFCFRLRQPSFHWIISGGVVNRIGRNGNVLILPTPIPSSLWLRLRVRFSIFTTTPTPTSSLVKIGLKHKIAGAFINQSFLGSPDHRSLFLHLCVPRVAHKSASRNLSRGLYMIKLTSKKTIFSNTKNL